MALWQDEEEGAVATTNIDKLEEFKNPDGSYTFLTPAGKPITLPKTLEQVYFSTGDNWEVKEGCSGYTLAPIGTLTHFIIKSESDNVRYNAKKDCNSKRFKGYKNTNGEYYKDIISYDLNPSQYIIGVPCLQDNEVVFKIDQINKSATYSYPHNNFGDGVIESFDYVVDKINWQTSVIYIDANIIPPYGEEALDFIDTRKSSAQQNSQLYPYIFTHAHQINKYPEVYRKCWMGSELNNEDFDQFIINSMTEKDYYGNPIESPLQKAIDYWKDKGYSTYYDYNKILEKFKNLENHDATTILELLNKTKDYICIWKEINAQGRINAIEKITSGSINSNEEQLLIDIINTIPNKDQASILYNYFNNDNMGLLAKLDRSIIGSNLIDYYESLSKLIILAMGDQEMKNKINKFENITSKKSTKSLNEYAQNKVFFWLNPNFIESVFSNEYKLNHKLLYENFSIADNGKITFDINEVRAIVSWDYVNVNLNPLELVRVDMKTSSDYLNTTEGETIYIPAVSLSLLVKEQWKQEMVDAINIALLVYGSGVYSSSGRTALIAKNIQQAISTEVKMILDYLRVTPKSFAVLFGADLALQASTHFILEGDWETAIGRIDPFDAAITGLTGNIFTIPINGRQLLHMAKFGKQFTVIKQLKNMTKVANIEFIKASFDYDIYNHQFKMLCDYSKEYHEVMSTFILSLTAKWGADEIHDMLKGWGGKVISEIESEGIDNISASILKKVNKIIQTENAQKVLNMGTKVFTDIVIDLKKKDINAQFKLKKNYEVKNFLIPDSTKIIEPLIIE
jgi:hypothetical protein